MGNEDVIDPQQPGGPDIYWHHVPTIYADGALGAAQVGGMQRIALGEFCMNITPGSAQPAMRPVCNLVMSDAAVRAFAQYLLDLPGVAEPHE